jgi:Flp pilus assembly protein CpaB
MRSPYGAQVRSLRHGSRAGPLSVRLRGSPWFVVRRVVAACAAALAVWLTVTALSADPQGPSVEVVVMATDAPAGHVLSDGDLRIQPMPESLVPGGAAGTPGRWRGHVLSGPVRAGAVLTDGDVILAALARGQPGDVVVTHVELRSASLARAATPGSRVAVVASADGEIVADDALVLAQSSADEARGSPGVFVAVPSSAARRMAVAGGSGGQLASPGSGLTLLLLPPPDEAGASG